MEHQARRFLEEVKYRQKFPPREAAAAKKSELAVRGLGQSGALAQEVATVYLRNLEAVLDEFTDVLSSKGAAIGLKDDVQITAAVNDAYQHMFGLAGSVLAEEFGGAMELGGLARDLLEERRAEVWEHLVRKIELRDLEQVEGGVRPVTKEREQKFGVLLSPGQAVRDFEAWVPEAKALANPIAVLFVDIDNFKALNERFTHAKVDQTILPEVQKSLARLVHSRGEAYRHGGEEFLLIMPNLDRREAEAFAEKVRASFDEGRFKVAGETVRITVSVGVAVWPDSGTTYQEVLEAANGAEVEAKKTRNTVRVAG